MKKSAFLSLAAVAAAAFLVFAPVTKAQAAEPFMPMYVSFSGGVYYPEGTDLDERNADPGLATFLNFGYMFNPFFGLQGDLGYWQTSGDFDLKVSSIPLAFSVKAGIPIAFFEPYALAGAGVYFTSSEVEVLGDTESSSSTDFGAHLAGGANFNFGMFQLGAEGRYIWLKTSDDNEFTIDGLMILGKFGLRF